MAVTTEQVQVQVEINGQKAGSTIKELQNTAKELRKELNQLPTDTDAFVKKAAELQKVNTQLKEINNTVKAVDKSMEAAGKTGGMFSNIMSGAMSVFLGGGLEQIAQQALGAIKDFFVGSVKGAEAMNRSFAQLEQALHGDTAAAKELAAQAKELEVALKGLFSEEDIKDAQTQLALYTQETDQIKKLTPQILDLAAAKGIDLKTAAEMVGKSLEGDSDKLKQMGISVKDAATEQERFTIISQALTDKFGGQAKVVADSTKTGWDQLVVKWDEMSKSVGEKLIPIINSLGEFLSDLWDKSQPVVDVFKTIFGVFGQVWDAIKQLIASFGLFNGKADAAGSIMKGLAIAMKPMQMAWEGLSFIIKGVTTALNELVAGANGTVDALVAIFSNFKTFFATLFGGIGEVIKGVFSFDVGNITEGLEKMKTSFTAMGSDIATAFNKGYNDVKDKQNAALVDDVKKTGDIITKGNDDILKKQQQNAANQAQLNDKLEEQRINAMKDGMAKQLALENLRFEREQKTTADKISELTKLGATQQQINEYTEGIEKIHQNNLTKIQQDGAAKRKADQDKIDAEKKKNDEEKLKQQAELNNKLAELYKQVEDIHIAAMQDGKEKQIAQENLRYQREQDAEVQRINDLRKAGADEATIKTENDKFEADSEIAHQNNLQDIRIKAEEKRKADAQKTADDLKKINDDAYKKQVDATNQFYDAIAVGMKKSLSEKIAAENLTSEQIQAEKDKSDTSLLKLEIAKNEELLKVQKDYGQDTLATENELANERISLAEKTAAHRKAVEDSMMQTASAGLDFAIELLSRDEEARKKNADLLKAFNIAKIAIDLEREIQGIWASVAELGPLLGPILGGVQTAFAIGRSVLAVSKLKSVKYAAGGYTGTGSGVDIIDSTGEPVAGVVHTKEWVAPKWMVSHPTYHNVINRLEGVRQRGFAEGGFTTTPVTNVSTNFDLMGTENKLDQLIQAFQSFPTRLKADVVYTEFETVANNVADVRNAAQVGK